MTILKTTVLSTLAVGLLALTACDSNRTDRAATNTDAEKREQTQVTGVQSNELNKTEEEKGSDKVSVQKQVTRTITSEERVPTILEGQKKLDINRMSAGDWTGLGMPKTIADNIVKYRDDHKGFKSIDELKQVPGVNDTMLRPFQGKLGFSNKE